MTGGARKPQASRTPSLRRRLACFTYEGVLLFGVLMIAGYGYSYLTQQRHALSGRYGLQVFLFVLLGIYFTWFWSHGGQTVAMKAWHIRVVDRAGAPLTRSRAFARYLASWLWFVPALLIVWLSGLQGVGPSIVIVAVGVICFALLSSLHPSRQFWHDTLCGTMLVTSRPSASETA